jgi:hypothetical protein
MIFAEEQRRVYSFCEVVSFRHVSFAALTAEYVFCDMLVTA